ncbi:MAG: cobalamin-dependent protein [Thermoleophilia bacterium]
MTQEPDKELERITEALTGLDEKTVLRLVSTAIDSGANALAVMRACEAGMRGVGERYERQEIYLSGLIMAGEIFRQVLEQIRPSLESELSGTATGKVLLGTAAGDIHDIGKDMAALALRTFGFTVQDLGVDVAPEKFLEAAKIFRPDIVGLSGLVSSAYDNMRETVRLIRAHSLDLGGRVFVIVGGGTIDEEVATFVGADAWTTDAMEGVRICQKVTT